MSERNLDTIPLVRIECELLDHVGAAHEGLDVAVVLVEIVGLDDAAVGRLLLRPVEVAADPVGADARARPVHVQDLHNTTEIRGKWHIFLTDTEDNVRNGTRKSARPIFGKVSL